jgi:hypothetical protein
LILICFIPPWKGPGFVAKKGEASSGLSGKGSDMRFRISIDRERAWPTVSE